MILYCLLMMYLSIFFSYLAVVGAAYLVCFAAQRARCRKTASHQPRPWVKMPAYNVDALDM